MRASATSSAGPGELGSGREVEEAGDGGAPQIGVYEQHALTALRQAARQQGADGALARLRTRAGDEDDAAALAVQSLEQRRAHHADALILHAQGAGVVAQVRREVRNLPQEMRDCVQARPIEIFAQQQS